MKTIIVTCSFGLMSMMPLSQIKAQITIGSTKPPKKGAILDLKTDESGNSTKGLLLPRVMLEDRKELKPMYTYEDAENTPSPTDVLSHAGLMVYNLTKQQKDPCDFTVGKLQEGVFIWSGKEWVDINNSQEVDTSKDKIQLSVRNPDVKIFIDNRDPDKPEPYACRRFGESTDTYQAGIWMTTNLRATKYDQTVHSNKKLEQGGYNPATQQSLSGEFYMAPAPYKNESGDINVGYVDYWVKENPIAGYIYNYRAIIYGGTVNAQKQGLCPKGWHVPSLSEWEKLKNAIYEHPEKYLEAYDDKTYPAGPNQNFSNALIVPCTPYGQNTGGSGGTSVTVIGRSKSYSDGGFGDFGLGTTMMSNKIMAYTKNEHQIAYDNLTQRFELSTTNSQRPQFIGIGKDSPQNKENKYQVFQYSATLSNIITNMMALRCVKDNNDFDF